MTIDIDSEEKGNDRTMYQIKREERNTGDDYFVSISTLRAICHKSILILEIDRFSSG